MGYACGYDEMGRFISEDPIGFAGGDVNFYARVGNNPVNFTDPWGLDKKLVGTASGIISNIFDPSGPVGYYGGTAIGAAAFYVLATELGLATAPALVGSIAIVMIAEPVLTGIDNTFFAPDFRSDENYILSIRQAEIEGAMYSEQLLQDMRRTSCETELFLAEMRRTKCRNYGCGDSVK